MDLKKTLFAGPFIGELGWEIFAWQGYLRRIAKNYERVIIVCRTGHNQLYRDFATEIYNYDPQSGETDMCHNRGESADLQDYHKRYTQGMRRLTVIKGDAYPKPLWLVERDNRNQQDFVRYAERGKGGYDVLMLARNTSKCNTGFRNWPLEHAIGVARVFKKWGYTVACVGKSDSALYIPGTDDQRNLPLSMLCKMMAESGVIVGPQSGPLHLATLCGLPQMSWQTKPEHAQRTKHAWNPFNVPTSTMPSDISYWKKRRMWLPSVKEITEATITLYQETKV